MDPATCLNNIAELWASGEYVEFTYAVEDLTAWVSKGGFLTPRQWDAYESHLDNYRNVIEREVIEFADKNGMPV